MDISFKCIVVNQYTRKMEKPTRSHSIFDCLHISRGFSIFTVQIHQFFPTVRYIYECSETVKILSYCLCHHVGNDAVHPTQ